MRNAIESGRAVLLDTCVLIAYLDPVHPQNLSVIEKVIALRHQGYQLCIAPQCLYELWVVLTRPTDRNGFGLSCEAAERCLTAVRESFTLLEDPPGMVDEWQRLCVKLQIVGRRAHDARLIAYMRGHGLDKLFTLNVSDFQAFTADGIQLI